MKTNGEATYGTCPWRVYGEGPTKSEGGHFGENKIRYTAEDIRFTAKGDALYAIVLGLPENAQVVVRSLAKQSMSQVTDVSLLGNGGDLKWSQTEDGLTVALPAQ